MITVEQWDTRWWDIYCDAVEDGEDSDTAELIADRETDEQFGPRPTEETGDA